MNWLLLAGILLVVWILVSQLIAWLITPSQNEDEVVAAWAAVFLAPPAIAIVVLDKLMVRWIRFWLKYLW